MASITKDEAAKTWTVRWREGGRGRRGRSRQKTFTKAGLATAFRKDKQDEEDRRGAGQPSGSGSWLLERFFADKFVPLRSGKVTPGTVATWTKRWAPKSKPQPWHLQRAFGGWALEEINYEAVLGWHADMRRAKATDSQIAGAHDLLVNVLNFAVKLRYIQANPAAGERPSYRPARVTGLWRPDTVELLREQLMGVAVNGRRRDQRWLADRDSVLIAVLAYLALRPGEALALTWQQVLDEHLWITHTIAGIDEEEERTVEDGRTKTSGDRRVPFKQAPFMRSLLLEWKLRAGDHDDTTPVFPTHPGGGVWPYHNYLSWRSQRWKKLLDACDIDYRKPYHLRHSCITMWIYQGVPLPEVAKRAGHSQQTCLNTYVHAWETLPERPFNMEAAFHAARAAVSSGADRAAAIGEAPVRPVASDRRPRGGLSIVPGGRDQA